MAKSTRTDRGRPTGVPGITILEDGRFRLRLQLQLEGHRRELERTIDACNLALAIAEKQRFERLLTDELQARTGALSLRDSVTDYAVRWLEARVASGIAPKTAVGYRDNLQHRILPSPLGARCASSVRRSDVVAWVVWVTGQPSRHGQPWADATLKGAWRVLVMLLRDLAADYEIPDPTRRVRPPRSERRDVHERRTMTLDEGCELLGWLGEHRPAWHPEVAFLCLTGCRPGEMYALRWTDVDRDRELVHIRRRVSWGQKGPVELRRTKTGQERSWPLTGALERVLADHLERQIREQRPGLSSGLIFPAAEQNRWGSWHRRESALRRVFDEAAASIGLGLRLRAKVLRRSVDTWLVAASTPGPIVRQLLGHSGVRMTDLYYGKDLEVARSAAESALEPLTRRDDE